MAAAAMLAVTPSPAPAAGPNAVVDSAGCQSTRLPRNDDGSSPRVALPGSLNLYGRSFSSLFVNNNGNVTFDAPLSSYTPFPLRTTIRTIIAPFFADVDTRAAGSDEVTYGTTTFAGRAALCVNWTGIRGGVGYYTHHSDKLNSFQLLLVDRSDVAAGDFDIVMNFDKVQWETGDASGGRFGLGGNSARMGLSNGDPSNPAASYEHPGSAVNGAFLDSNQSGLVHRSRGTSQLGRYIFEVRNGTPDTPPADDSPPSTGATFEPEPNAAGWHRDDATVVLKALDEDGGSGVRDITYSASGAQTISETTVSGSSARIPVTAEGETTIRYFATDAHGNREEPKTTSVRIDKTQPATECASADGAWHGTDVELGCSATDGGSGLAEGGDATFGLATNVADGTETADAATGSREVCDLAGNCVTAGPVHGNKVDKRAPSVTITSPLADATFLLSEAVSSNYGCADGGSGVASCVGPVPSGTNVDTGSVGPKSFAVRGVDRVSNAATETRGYKVVYDFEGFFRPVNNLPVVNNVNGGRTIPVKFSLNGDQGLDILASGYPKSQQIPCGSSDPVDGIEEVASPGSSTLQYDSTKDQYQYNWKTDASWAGTCRQLVVRLADGTSHRATFKFK